MHAGAADADSADMEVSFNMDGDKADKIAAGDDAGGDVTKFKDATEKTIRETLNEGRDTSSNGLARARLVSTSIESPSSSRRSLLDYKALKVGVWPLLQAIQNAATSPC
eukprot:1146660-Pelagomonas_calceolata.AAC.3